MTNQTMLDNKKPYLRCPRCERWLFSIEKLHCYICPICRHILKYKDGSAHDKILYSTNRK